MTPETAEASSRFPKVSLLSFVVPTLTDVEEALRELYEGICEQAEQVADDWEVLIVDQGAGEKIRQGIVNLTERDPAHVRCLESTHDGRSGALALGYRVKHGESLSSPWNRIRTTT